ncbi:hypothetical protein HYALB_00004129 [Hymenoscyphus albidus]|uniref:ATP11-domain-containing protein n=1 Tax=Hymenoscyphus albidus TaxID=595503 RepID=A0A9N9LIM4_9HELO|nr:hypothetical protein HYALB_00004129 [Hymenoscyphus albidus]
MASFRVPTLRNIFSGAAPYLRPTQRRWAQVHDIRFLATDQSSKILEKYKEKLAQKAKEEGLQDITQLQERYKDKIQELKKKASIPLPNLTPPPSPPFDPSSPFPAPPPPPKPQVAGKTNGIKTLNSYVDVEKSLALPVKELETIWRLRHAAHPQTLCAVVPVEAWKPIQETAKRWPTFLLPLPKGVLSTPDTANTPASTAAGGSAPTEIHILQWSFPAPDTVTVIFTHLAEFKLRGEYSEPHTTVTFHTEMLGEKGVVMMRGEVREGRGVSVDESKWLVMCLQKFYGVQSHEGGGRRRQLVEMFGRGDGGFSVEELVGECERVV